MDYQQEPARKTLPTFIGRDAQIAELSAGLDDAIGGRGRLFLISGEPGIGKTMLAERIAVRAAEQGAQVLWGRCWEGSGAPAYWPWTQILRPLVEQRNDETHVDASAAVVDLASLFPELGDRSGEGRDQKLAPQSAAVRFRLFAAVGALLQHASSVRPLLIVFDDLHDADPASLLLLRFIARDLRDERVLIVATYRDIEAHHSDDVVAALGGLVREGPSIHLGGFGRAEVRQFVESLTGTPASDDALSRIYEASGGNPLFVREIVRLAESSAASESHAHPSMPEGVRVLIHQRLASLDANAVHVLSVAAVLGQEFDPPLVEQVSALSAPGVLQAIAHAERSGLVARAPGSGATLRFSHGLVREVLYDDLPIAVRKELHGKVGAVIERLHGPDLTPYFGRLAYHFAQAAVVGEGARAVDYAQRAADHAMDSCAYEEAAAQYRRALEALQYTSPDDALRCELLLREGTAQARAGDYQSAKAGFARAAELARRLEAPEQLARAALGFGEPQVEGLVDPQLLALLREALDSLNPNDSTLRARLLARLSLELSFSSDPALRDTRRDSLSREALDMARRLGDAEALSIALRARWLALWGPEGLEQRAGLAEEMLGLARSSGDREMELVGRARRITCSMELGDIRTVEADIGAHVRLAEELRMPYHEWAATTLRACRAMLDASFDVAEELAQRAPSLIPGRPIARLAHLNQITFIRWEQGRLGELRDAWQSIVDRFPQTGFGMAWLSLTQAARGETDLAQRNLHAQVEALVDLPRGGLWLSTLSATALAAAHLDNADAAAAVYPLLLPYASRTIVVPVPHPVMCCGSASLYLGLLAATMSRWDEAKDHFRSAIDDNTRLGARAFLARTQYEFARMLCGRGRAEDRSAARALLEQAETTARSAGMLALRSAIERLRDDESAPTAADGQLQGRPATGVDAATRTGDDVFHREGDYWTVAHAGAVVRLRDSKGLRYLSRLLTHPDREFHVIDLQDSSSAAPAAAPRSGPTADPGGLQVRSDLGDAGDLLDARAKAEYKARLRDLQEDLDEAERFNDPVRASQAKEEIDFIASELARAVGLGGRDRKAASHAERARLNVTRAIKAALNNIDKNHPSLGRHLRSTIKTGRYCSYTPDPRTPITWES